MQGNATFVLSIAFFKNDNTKDPLAAATDKNNSGNKQQDEKQTTLKEQFVSKLRKNFISGMMFRHCEIGFPPSLFQHTNNPNLIACGIIVNGTVFIMERTFSRDEYTIIDISVTRVQIESIFNFCKSQQGKPYDKIGADRSGYWPTECNYKNWYCTNLTVCALQQGGILTGMNPNAVTVDDIYNFIITKKTEILKLTPKERKNLSGKLQGK